MRLRQIALYLAVLVLPFAPMKVMAQSSSVPSPTSSSANDTILHALSLSPDLIKNLKPLTPHSLQAIDNPPLQTQRLDRFVSRIGALTSTDTSGSSNGSIQLGLTSQSFKVDTLQTDQVDIHKKPLFRLHYTDLSTYTGYLNNGAPGAINLGVGTDDSFLLNPATQSKSFQFIGYSRVTGIRQGVKSSGLLSRILNQGFLSSLGSPLVYYRLGASFSDFSTTVDKGKATEKTLTAPGAILEMSFGPKFRFTHNSLIPDVIIDSSRHIVANAQGDTNAQDEGVNEFSLEMGPSFRQIMGVISTKGVASTGTSADGQSYREAFFGTKKTAFLGGEATLSYQVAGAQPFLRVGYFPYGSSLPGFSGWNAFVGVNVSATLSIKQSATPTTIAANALATTPTSLVQSITPTITSLNPQYVVIGDAAFTMFVRGTGFASTSKIQWNGQVRPTTRTANGALSATITEADTARAGTAKITVTTDGVTSEAKDFTITSTETPAAL